MYLLVYDLWLGINKSPSHQDKTKKSGSCLNLPSALFNHKINMLSISYLHGKLYDRSYPVNIFIHPCINSRGCTATCGWTKTNNTYYCPSERNEWYENFKKLLNKISSQIANKITCMYEPTCIENPVVTLELHYLLYMNLLYCFLQKQKVNCCLNFKKNPKNYLHIS